MSKIKVLEVPLKLSAQKDKLNLVILEDDNEMVLIDSGHPGYVNTIEEIAENNDVDIKRLTKIIITHHDYDHMGSLAEFKRKYPKVQVLASKEDEPYINGNEKSLRLQQAEGIFETLTDKEKRHALYFHKMLEGVENCDVDITVQDKDYFDICGGIEIVSTPGHMPGHISVYHKGSKSLITGDALVVEDGELAPAVPKYTLDIEESKRSIKKLLDYDIDRIICYHGGSYTKDIKESLDNLTK